MMWVIAPEVVERYGDPKKVETAIGTGPFLLEGYEPNVKSIFRRNPDYFLPGLPYVDGVEWLVLDDESTAAVDKQAIIEVERLGFGRPTGSIIPRTLEFALPLEPFPYDPAQARRLLPAAGYPNGLEAGDLLPTSAPTRRCV